MRARRRRTARRAGASRSFSRALLARGWRTLADPRWRRAVVSAAARAWRALDARRGRALLAAAAALTVLAAANAVLQAVRKPTELLAAVAPTSPKTPEETWAAYGDSFREHSTSLVRPELLAALAQVESAGDPLARTYWRWRWSWNPLEVYAPASSAVGLLQITDGTFAEARRLCIRDHALAREGGWLDPGACRLNGLYFRVLPDHAIELTSAWLHASLVEALAGARAAAVPPGQRERLAAVVHLCGRARGVAFARNGFRVGTGERCGEHDLAAYLARVRRLEVTFALLAAAR